METLSPAQRVIVIAIGLALTVLAAISLLPWANRQIAARLPPTPTPPPATTTPRPTATATQQPTPTATPTLALTPPAQVSIDAVAHVAETAGNNGPASLAIVLSHWGYTDTQGIIAATVRPGTLDESVELQDLAEYARSRGVAAHSAASGSVAVLRQLLANGFPVIIDRWMAVTTAPEAQHYQVARGYDDAAGTLLLQDPSLEPDQALDYAALEPSWKALNRPYLVVCPPEQQGRLRAILGDAWDEATMWEQALAQAEEEIAANPEDAFAWVNQGAALAGLGQYTEAREAFETALTLSLPEGLAWHRFEIYECLQQLAAHQEILTLTQRAVEPGPGPEQLHLYRAQAYAALGDAEQARAEYERTLEIRPGWGPAEEGLAALSP